MELKIQKSTDSMWTDEAGLSIPYNRTTKVERLMERKSYALAKKANGLSNKLKSFKDEVREVCQDVYDTYMASVNNDKKNKGNFTWYNFNRSIKVEVSISERIEFDDLGIKACKDKLDEFLKNNITAKNDFIKQLVFDAFETKRGALDAKKVTGLLRYRNKIKKPTFQEALDLIESSIRRPDSKMYFRISVRNEEGKYDNIDLNFSSIN